VWFFRSRMTMQGTACHPNVKSYVPHLNFVRSAEPLPTYRIMDENGAIVASAAEPDASSSPVLLTLSQVSEEFALKMYTTMAKVAAMDPVLYDAQRQGRISFYMTSFGEEGTQVGSAAALDPQDVLFGQYREVGAFLWRGFSYDDVANQCTSNHLDSGKGRQMPMHFGSKKLNFQTISSPLGTQIPQATGAGYALKVSGSKNCVLCYFGEGAASEGDFHPALNFAATLSSPTIFFCRFLAPC
jgi:2-oxoisovalerate dehydrogenase E1 component alpha subunit